MQIQTQSKTDIEASSKKSFEAVKSLLNDPAIKSRFEELLLDKAAPFMSSLISLASSNEKLKKADPQSFLSAAVNAATLDLPVNPQLGFAYIIPYERSGTGVFDAQFQMGYKGYIQLALRTGQYKKINSCAIYQGQLVSKNNLTGEYIFDFSVEPNGDPIGFAAYFRLLNGAEATLYMTDKEMHAHANKYSKTYRFSSSKWKTSFKEMGLKTVIKLLLSKWGILSTQMQKAIETDQARLNEDGTADYLDSKQNGRKDVIDMPPSAFEQEALQNKDEVTKKCK